MDDRKTDQPGYGHPIAMLAYIALLALGLLAGSIGYWLCIG